MLTPRGGRRSDDHPAGGLHNAHPGVHDARGNGRRPRVPGAAPTNDPGAPGRAAAPVVAGILALSPVVARAERGPAMGPGMGSEMGQRSLPAEKRDDAPPRG